MPKRHPGPAVVILAAGKGSRLKSDLPKALHTLCGETMLGALLEKVDGLKPSKTVIVAGHRIDLVRGYLNGRGNVVHQKRLLGSGHAVLQAKGILAGFSGPVVVIYCDTPLLSLSTLHKLLERRAKTSADCVLLSARFKQPFGYGRIVRRNDGRVGKIVEHNDATRRERAIREINVGCYVFDSKKLFQALKWVRINPRKKEYYLTDAVGLLAREGRVEAIVCRDNREVLGINTPLDLAEAQEIMQKNILEKLIQEGVRIRDPKTTVIDAGVQIGEGTIILPHTVIEEKAIIGKNCVVGPFARIRGRSRVSDGVVIGNFVEIVRSVIGKSTTIKHLSYVGDAEVGARVNIGAGTITANYDGKRKHKTVIRDGARIGSGTVLVAPVTIGRAAVTGAGAVVTKGRNVADRAVVIGVPARVLKKNNKNKGI